MMLSCPGFGEGSGLAKSGREPRDRYWCREEPLLTPRAAEAIEIIERLDLLRSSNPQLDEDRVMEG
jgi:hypothetical protein